ncbi:uncharacterized protein V6R79_024353 [Siganus canaliculatus]
MTSRRFANMCEGRSSDRGSFHISCNRNRCSRPIGRNKCLFLPAADTTSQQMTQSVSTSASQAAETGSTVTTSPGLQVPSNHSQAASTSQQMTQSVSTSASQAAETGSTVTISPGLQVRSNHSQEFSGKTATAVALPSLVIICACIGILYYKSRNNRNNRRGTEEEIPMNSPSCGPPAALDTGLSSSHVLLPQNQSSSDD